VQVIKWVQFLKEGLPLNGNLSSMTVGIFDGVHLGHQALIRKIISHDTSFIPVIVTFRQNHKAGGKEIQNFDKKLDMFKNMGIQITVVIDFTSEFKQMPGIEFLQLLLKHGNIGFFAAGQNFRCGHQMDTEMPVILDFFASNGISAEIVPEVYYPAAGLDNSLPVSSSRIRTALAAGDTTLAQKMLGYPI